MTLLRRTTIATLCLAVLPLAAQQIQISKDNKTIAITTSGDASAMADLAVVTVGFETYGKDQNSTYADATRTSNAIISALTATGIPKDAVQSEEQNFSSLESNSDDDKVRYSQGIRFKFSQSWRVTVPADQAANALHIAITSGANNSGGIDWQLKDDDALESQAAAKALEHARSIAEHMAQGLGARLGMLVYASNQAPPRGIFALNGMLNTSSASLSPQPVNLKPLAISPNRITRSATVYAVFAIE
jgi:uncharacterized protein